MLKKVFYQKYHSADELNKFLNQLYKRCNYDKSEMNQMLLGITQSSESYTVFYLDFITSDKNL